jgi:hypothetical protein
MLGNLTRRGPSSANPNSPGLEAARPRLRASNRAGFRLLITDLVFPAEPFGRSE